VVPHGTDDLQNTKFAHPLYNFSEGEDSKAVVDGKTAKDGVPFKYESEPHQSGGDQIASTGPEEVRNTQGQEVVEEGRKIIENMSKDD
jgi:Mn-containing catalase